MDEMQLLGYAVTIVITLGSFIAVIQKFTQPINDLRVVIQELRDCIKMLKSDSQAQDRRLQKHGEQIDELDKKVNHLETKMSMYHGERK